MDVIVEKQRRESWLLNALHVVIDGLSDSVPILLSFMVVSLGAGEKEAGAIVSIQNLVNTALGLSAIVVFRRFGLFRALSLAVMLLGAAFVANAFSRSIVLAGAAFVIGGAGFSVFHNVAFSHLVSSAERGSLGRTLGNFTAIGDVGRIPLASLAGFVAALSVLGIPGWRVVCLTYGAGALIFAGLVFWKFTSSDTKVDDTDSSKPPGDARHLPSFSLLRNRQTALSITASVLDALGSNTVFMFLPFLLFAKGIDPRILGGFALAFTTGSFLGKAMLGRMVDRFGTRRVFVLSEAAMTVLLLVLILAQRLPAIIGASLLLGIVTKGTVPVIQAIIAEPMRQPYQRGEIIAINSLLRGLTGIAAPVLLGMIASAAGIAWSFGVMALVVAIAPVPVLLAVRSDSSS